jgi:hypothetical protein
MEVGEGNRTADDAIDAIHSTMAQTPRNSRKIVGGVETPSAVEDQRERAQTFALLARSAARTSAAEENRTRPDRVGVFSMVTMHATD